MNKIQIFLVAIIINLFLFINIANADNFNPNYIISDFEILNHTSMTEKDIQNLLEKKNSYLASYSCDDPDGKAHKASKIIYNRATINKINPKFLIVLLQKEMSLIEDDSPTQRQLDWATGYGCPDGSNCNPRWKGFWKQVNSASLQFKDYMEDANRFYNKSPYKIYSYQPKKNYIFTNPYSTIVNETTSVIPSNQATASLYNYTPHVYNGNYNFYKIWQRYFTRDYTNGSLLQAEGEIGVWLIQNEKKRPFHTKSALISRFDKNKIITISKSELDKYETGTPIKFPNYSLVRSPKGNVFLLVDDKRCGFSSNEVFKKIGYNPEEIINASWEDIKSYKEGLPITNDSTYPTGALLQDNKTGGVYWVFEGKKSPIFDAIFLKTKFKHKKIISVSQEELNSFVTIAPILFIDGELIKSVNSTAIYLVDQGKKRPFTSSQDFENLGYKWENIITVSPKVLYLYEIGEAIISKSI